MKAKKRTVGSIVKVPLKNGEHTYAAFYFVRDDYSVFPPDIFLAL